MTNSFLRSVLSPSLFDSRKCGVEDGAIAAGVNFIGGLISNNTNKKLVRETNAQNLAMFNQQMAQQEKQFQQTMDYQTMDWNRNRQAALEDWYRETEYNDPLKQKERYMNAGINPALAMQGQNAAIGSMESSAGGSSPSPGSMPGIPQLQAPQDQLGENIARATDMYLRSRATESDSRLKDEQANQIAIDNRTREQMNIVELNKVRNELRLQRQKLKYGSKDYERLSKEIELLDDQIAVNFATFDARVKKPEVENFVTHETGRQFMIEADRLQIQKNLDDLFAYDERLAKLQLDRTSIAQLSASIANLRANTSLTYQQKNLAYAETCKKWLEANDLNPNSERGRYLLDLLELQKRQAGADYWNPFNYVGKALGGSVGATKVVK